MWQVGLWLFEQGVAVFAQPSGGFQQSPPAEPWWTKLGWLMAASVISAIVGSIATLVVQAVSSKQKRNLD